MAKVKKAKAEATEGKSYSGKIVREGMILYLYPKKFQSGKKGYNVQGKITINGKPHQLCWANLVEVAKKKHEEEDEE